MRFYLGTHKPHWLGLVDFPLMVSHRTLAQRRTLPRARAPWALDSGGFTEIATYGHWTIPPQAYVEAVARYAAEIGQLDWAAPQDWMCEPIMVERSGLSVAEHQHRTIVNYLELRTLAPGLPFVPVLQGWRLDDYLLRTTTVAARRLRAPRVAGGSCALGRAAVWLDAMLAKQTQQTLDLLVQPLVLLDQRVQAKGSNTLWPGIQVQPLVLLGHRVGVRAGRPQLLRLLLLRPPVQQLLFDQAQHRGGVEVLRGDRGVLCPLHVGKLVVVVGKASRSAGGGRQRSNQVAVLVVVAGLGAEAERSACRGGQRTSRAGWLALLARAWRAVQQAQHLLVQPGVVSAELDQHLRGDTLALAAQAQQEVLGAEVVVAQPQRLAQGDLHDLLGPGRRRDVPDRSHRPAADDLLHLGAHGLQRDAKRRQRPGGDAAHAQQPEQQVLGAEVVVVEQPGFLLGCDRGSACPLGEPRERVVGSGGSLAAGQPTSHRCLLGAGIGLVTEAQPGCQPGRQGGRIERARGQLGKHLLGRLGWVQVGLPAVEGQELQRGQQRELLVGAPERAVADQGVQQDSGVAGGVVSGVLGWPGGQRGLGRLHVQQADQVQRGGAVDLQRPAGDDDQVGHLERDHGWSSRSSRSRRWWRARLSSSSLRKRWSRRRCSTRAAMASRATSEIERPSTWATGCSCSASSGSSRSSMFLVLPGSSAVIVISRYHGGGWVQAPSGSPQPCRSATTACGHSLPRRSLRPPNRRGAERHDGWLGQEPAHLLELLVGAGKAGLEPVDLAEPAPLACFANAVLEIGDDHQQPRLLQWVGVQHRAADAGVLVSTGGAVGARAGAQLDPSLGEVLFELGPLGRGRLAVLLPGPLRAAPADERPVVAQHVVLVDGCVRLRGVEVLVAEDLGGDMDRQPAGNGLGGEDPAEVVRGVAQGLPVRAAQPGPLDRQVEQALHNGRTNDPQFGAVPALEQVRQRRAGHALVLVVAAHQRDAGLARTRCTIRASTCASSGETSSSRSVSVLYGATCSSGTTSPVSGRVWVTSAKWVSSSSSSSRMPVCRRVSTIAQVQNASSSSRVRSRRWWSASRRARRWPAPACPPRRRSLAAWMRSKCSPLTSNRPPIGVAAAAATSRSRWPSRSSTLATSWGSSGASVRVRWCIWAVRRR